MRNLIYLFLIFTACQQSAKHTSEKANMDSVKSFFQEIYQNFNERNIDFVISNMTRDVKWANGMEGGFVYGHDGVREYWLRQFKVVSSNVTPVEIDQDGQRVRIKVHQVVHDLDGKLLADEFVYHYFQLVDGKIASFEIGEKSKE